MMCRIIIVTLMVVTIAGCGSSKSASEKNDMQEKIKVLKSQGFTEGIIVHSEKPDDCEYTIKVAGGVEEFLDPVNLDEKFKHDGQTIWFKYTSLRRQNRCQKARPVELTEVKTLE